MPMGSKRKLSVSEDVSSNKKACAGSRHASINSSMEKVNKSTKATSESCGIIESISLRNFMCHSRLTMRFSSSVNFIVGHNGSGKSAVLTAIIVGLGGKATSTSRGTSLKTLIKTGSNAAVVEITLRNDGCDPQPIKPDVYGDKIIVERKISADGQSAYKIKTSTGKVISTKKEDLMRILDEINLHVDNPLTCLNQEMSKTFLHSKSDTDKYKFFLKSTQLDEMCRNYRFIEEQKIIIQNVLNHKQKAIPDLENEVLEKEQRFKDLATLQELKNKVEALKCELAWSQVAQLEHSLKPLRRDLERETLRTPKYNEAVEKCKQKEAAAQKKFDDFQELVKQYQEKVKTLEPDKKKAKSAFDLAKSQSKTTENALNRAKRQRSETQKDKNQMEARILELKSSVKTDIEDEKRQREAHIASLHGRAEELKAQLKTTSHQADQFLNAVQQCRDQLQTLKQEEREYEQEQRKFKQILSNLSAGRRSKLQLFGSKMPDFVRQINEKHTQHKFIQKPRGPIGSCVSLKDPNLAVPVECAIRGFVYSFVVDNHKDEKVLERLRNSIFAEHERSRIVIYTVRFTDHIYDVTNGKARHSIYSSVLDLLTVEDPVIANCLIDMAHIESILVIPNTEAALNTMQKTGPPQNCHRAYTSVGDEVLPDRFYSNMSDPVSRYLKADVDGEIKRNRNLLKKADEQIVTNKQEQSKCSGDLKRNEQEQRRHDRMKTSIMNQLKDIQIEMRDLESIEDPQPLDVKDLEDEVLNYTQQVTSMSTIIEELTQEKLEYTNEVAIAKAQWDGVHSKMKEIAESAEDLTEKINQASKDLEKSKADRVHFNEGKKKHLETIAQVQTKIDDLKKKIDCESEKASFISKEKIITRRTSNNLENEIKQINRRISQEETHHGDHESIVREYHEAKNKFIDVKKRIRSAKKLVGQIANYLTQRHTAFETMRSCIAMSCTLDFNALLNQRGFKGKMYFNHDEQRLSIYVQPHDNASQSSDLRVLSGGERSFSTVCYVMALWQAIHSPLRCLDEFDVFMDMANRRVAMDMMVEMALDYNNGQYIFLTPHDISALPKSNRLHVWKMADPDRNQTHLPFERL